MLDKVSRKKKLEKVNNMGSSEREKYFRELPIAELKLYWTVGLRGEAYKDFATVVLERKGE